MYQRISKLSVNTSKVYVKYYFLKKNYLQSELKKIYSTVD